ncbi:uncharacterized protein BP5553_04877 [Venustampulla echinocandica]|uniref:Uncharacterized protein n=1 Tax=Venustampulla echinocandica TaxID=2656787 RepID=A0A370TPJ8_9HELO|nr:uncharacterized protein BP5553_04877 [Venustampulla echinocandica]RDL37444.1 hypothetical protein BP5553_04877 [Venustampulla echinocandica]
MDRQDRNLGWRPGEMDRGFLVQSLIPVARASGSQGEIYYRSNLGMKRGRSPSTMNDRPDKRQNSQNRVLERTTLSKAQREYGLASSRSGNLGQDQEMSHSLPRLGASRDKYIPYGRQILMNDSLSHSPNDTIPNRTNRNAFQSHGRATRDRHEAPQYAMETVPRDEPRTFTRNHDVASEAFGDYQDAGIYGGGTHFRRRHEPRGYEQGGHARVDAEQSGQLQVGQAHAVKIAGRYATTCGSVQELHPLYIDRRHVSYGPSGSSLRADAMAPRGIARARLGRNEDPRTISMARSEIPTAHTPKMVLRSSHGSPYSTASLGHDSQEGRSPSGNHSISVESLLRRHNPAQLPNSRTSEGRHYDVAKILPNRAISFNNRRASRPPALQENVDQFRPISPDAVSHPSSPEIPNLNSPPPAPIRSIPMRERISPIKKAAARNPKKTMTVSKELIQVDKKPSTGKRAEEPIPPELERQIRAAQLIVRKEQEATAAEIFGEEANKSKEERLEKERTEEKRRRQIAEAERLDREEARRMKEQMKARLREEEAEQVRLEKHRQEVRGKLRRKGERKKREAAEVIATEEHRRKAEEKIQAERQKQAAQAEERRKEKLKATELQAEASEVAKLKAKQEEIKKQVASLIVGNNKMSSGEGRSRADGDRNTSVNRAADDMWEDSLFISRDPSPIQDDLDTASFEEWAQPKRQPLTLPALKDTYDIDGRGTRGTSRAPTTAAELWALAPSKGLAGDYRKEREALDAERLAKGLEAARARLAARRERRKSTPLRQLRRRQQPLRQQLSSIVSPDSVARNSKTTQQSKNEQAPKKPPRGISNSNSEFEIAASSATDETQTNLDNSSGHNGAIPSDADYTVRLQSPPISSDANALEPPHKKIVSPIPRPNLPSPLPQTPKPPAPKPLAPPKVFKSSVTLISDADRLRAESNQRLKDEENAKQQRARIEKQKAERRRRESEKARERKRQQLLEDARNNDTELSEEALNTEVEAYMAKREKDIQKRAENRALKEKIQDFAPDNLLLESLAQAPDPQSESFEPQGVHGGAILGSQQLNAREAAARDSLRSLAVGRGGRLNPAAIQRIVDYSDSDESEEDPDDPLPEEYTYDGLLSDGDNDNGQNNDVIESSEPEFPGDSGNGLKSQSIPNQNSSTTCANQATSVIRLYTAMETATIDGIQGEPAMKQTFSDMDEANLFTRDLAERYRARNPTLFSERFGEDGLYQGDIDFDNDGKHSVMLYVAASLKSTADLVKFDDSVMGRRLPDRTWLVSRKVESRADGEGGSSSKILTKKKILSAFSDLILANNEAYTKCFEFLRPTRPAIDHVEQHENSWGPILRQERDKSNLAKLPVSFDLEPDKDQLQWVQYGRIKFKVKEYKMNGPTN